MTLTKLCMEHFIWVFFLKKTKVIPFPPPKKKSFLVLLFKNGIEVHKRENKYPSVFNLQVTCGQSDSYKIVMFWTSSTKLTSVTLGDHYICFHLVLITEQNM